MKKLLVISIALIVGLFVAPKVEPAHAAFLQFDKTTITIEAGQSVDLAVQVDTDGEDTSSVDAYVLFDGAVLDAQSVADGDFYPTVTHNIQSGKVYIAGLVEDPATSRAGKGTIATIKFLAKTNGTSTVSFDCREGAFDSSKIIKNDINATNIIVCSQNTSSTVTVGSGGGSTNTTGPSPTPCQGCSGINNSVSTGGTPDSLPQSGIFDNMLHLMLAGAGFVAIGGVLRLLL